MTSEADDDLYNQLICLVAGYGRLGQSWSVLRDQPTDPMALTPGPSTHCSIDPSGRKLEAARVATLAGVKG